MKKTIFIISIIVNILLAGIILYFYNSNKVKLSTFYMKSTKPVAYSFARGLPVDRYYIEKFLEKHKEYIHGNVLEMQNSAYTNRYGEDKVTKSDVLDLDENHIGATFTGDLQETNKMPANKFDCYILTQTIQYPYDIKATLNSVHKMLKKGGAVIITAPILSQMFNEPNYEESWRFTEYSLKRLLEDAGFEVRDIHSYGNSFAGTLFINGIAVEDVKDLKDLDDEDTDCPILVAALAIKK